MNKLLLWSAIFFFAVSCSAQKNEVDVVLGRNWALNSNTTFSSPAFSSTVTLPSGSGTSLIYEVGFSRRLRSFRPASLSLEFNAAGFPTTLRGNRAAVFVVPAAKFNFLSRSRISPFASAGAGFAHLATNSTNTAAFQFGGGFDVKTPIRFLNLRAEGRDFLALDSGLATGFGFGNSSGVTAKGSSRHYLMVGGGAVLRF